MIFAESSNVTLRSRSILNRFLVNLIHSFNISATVLNGPTMMKLLFLIYTFPILTSAILFADITLLGMQFLNLSFVCIMYSKNPYKLSFPVSTTLSNLWLAIELLLLNCAFEMLSRKISLHLCLVSARPIFDYQKSGD